MTGDEYDALWTCGYCGRSFVVPSMARDCETKHEVDQ